jgi:hypothetical protein
MRPITSNGIVRTSEHLLSRRRFATLSALSLAPLRAQTRRHVPIGLQQTAVGKNIQEDLPGMLRAAARAG